jgi:integrase
MKDRSTARTPTRAPRHCSAREIEGPRSVAAGMTPFQRRALQQLLFTSTEPDHTLGEAIARYRGEYLDLGTLAQGTRDWRHLACSRLSDWADRSIAAQYRDVGIELYRRHGQCSGSQATNTLGRILNLARSPFGWRHEEHDLRGLTTIRSRRREATVSSDNRPALLAALQQLAVDRPRRADACAIARLLLLTGMRVGEACAIEWAHVDISQRLVVLPRTKSGRARIVPLCAAAVEILATRPRGGVHVFRSSRHPHRHVDEGVVNHALAMACEMAGVPRTVPHTLRHTWATEAMRAGVADEVAMRALGHRSRRMLAVYQHARVDDVAAAMEIVGARVLGKAGAR